MKHLLTLLAALTILVSPAAAQTIKSLGFNTTNGYIVANTGTNVLRFTNNVSFQGGPLISASGIFYDTTTSGGINLEETTLTDPSNSTVFTWGDGTVSFSKPISFANTTNAASTRTNLGLNSTNVYVYAATGLWDVDNEKIAVRMLDMDVDVSALMLSTNGPTNTTNAVRWIDVLSGTNVYKLPLYQ